MSEQKLESKGAGKKVSASVNASKKLDNVMREVRLEKVVLSAGAIDKELVKAKDLLALLSGMRPQVIASSKRIPAFNVRPGLEVGTRVTLRGAVASDLLKRLLVAVGGILFEDQIAHNHFSFGIKEYIEIPGMEYQRNIGIRGLNVTVVFMRQGARVRRKKVKAGRVPKRNQVQPEEIIKFMKDGFEVKFQ